MGERFDALGGSGDVNYVDRDGNVTAMHLESEPVTDANFAAYRAAARKSAGPPQKQLADVCGAHATHVRRCEANTSQSTPDISRALALALSVTAHSRLLDEDEGGPQTPPLNLTLEADEQFTPVEQDHVAALIEGALLSRRARSPAHWPSQLAAA